MGSSVKNLVNPAHLPGMPGGSMNPMKPFGSSVDPSNPMNPLGIGQGSGSPQGGLQQAIMEANHGAGMRSPQAGMGQMQPRPMQVPGQWPGMQGLLPHTAAPNLQPINQAMQQQQPGGFAGYASHLMPPTMYPGQAPNLQPINQAMQGLTSQQQPQQQPQPSMGLSQGTANPFARPMVN